MGARLVVEAREVLDVRVHGLARVRDKVRVWARARARARARCAIRGPQVKRRVAVGVRVRLRA